MAAMRHRHKRKIDIERWDGRITEADCLFAAELAWLCEYALNLHEQAGSYAARIDCVLDAVSGPIVSEPTFCCAACQLDVPWSQGAADEHPDLCNECWGKQS